MPLENLKKNKINLSHPHERKVKGNVLTSTPPQGVPQSPLLSASLTVEAALVFPMFLFGLVTVLFFFRVLQVTQITSGALAATGSWLVLNAEEKEPAMSTTIGYFHKELLEKDFPDKFLLGGRLGIGWSGTELSGEYVDLRIRYQCRLPFQMFGVGNIPISQRVRMKKWTGYHEDNSGGAQEQMVYITPNNQVYHLSGDCTYLRLSTRIMEKMKALEAGYTACLFCGKEQSLYSYYYVTDEGRKYHTRLNCSGLKRTVYVVKISEAGSRKACSRCGG